MVALGRVVVDDVQDDLDLGLMQPSHHGLELELSAARRDVVGLRREEADRVVAPIVAQAPLDQESVLDEGVDRHQLDGRDPEPHQMIDHGRMGQTGIGAALPARHFRVQFGQSLDVRLVDDGPSPGRAQGSVIAPGVSRVDHDAFRHRRRVVAPVDREILPPGADAVTEMGVRPVQVASDVLGVGVEQELARVEPVPPLGRVRPMHPVAIELARPQVRQIAVPHFVGISRQGQPGDLAPAAGLEQAQLDPFGMGREEGEIDPAAIPGGAQGCRVAGPDPWAPPPLAGRSLALAHRPPSSLCRRVGAVGRVLSRGTT